ncbi:hypothetical protein C8R44DRAFT_819464 [Mycena epipterygia]|nr:hypothetical protein C8R44DRAFT_819464 [Mycena epipterygia]
MKPHTGEGYTNAKHAAADTKHDAPQHRDSATQHRYDTPHLTYTPHPAQHHHVRHPRTSRTKTQKKQNARPNNHTASNTTLLPALLSTRQNRRKSACTPSYASTRHLCRPA